MVGKNIDKGWVEQQIAGYAKVYPRYQKLHQFLIEVLAPAIKQVAPSAIVQARAKSLQSFANKVMRTYGKYDNPVRDFTDLCGLRIIVQSADDIGPVCSLIKESFIINQGASFDVSGGLKIGAYGHRPIQYIGVINPDSIMMTQEGVSVPKTVLPDKTSPMWVEIQVRRMLEHIWLDYRNEMMIRNTLKLPGRLRRELSSIAPLLENADALMEKIAKTIKKYTSSYESYLSPEEILDEISIQQVILEHAPGDFKTAHKIGQLYIALGYWGKAIDVLSDYVKSGHQPLLRDIGVAICKQSKDNPESAAYKKGQAYLEKAVEMDGYDVDAISSLAGTWKNIDDKKALELYKLALEIDPGNPYVLGNYLEYRIGTRKIGPVISVMGPVINAAIERCWEQIEAGVNYPWAYYDLGKFYLLMRNPDMSMAAYTRALGISTASFMVDTSLNSLMKLKPAVERWFDLPVKLFRIVRDVKFRDKHSPKEIQKLASKNFRRIEGPVVIVVGSHNKADEAKVDSYRQVMLKAFSDYDGNIISGGTFAGISKIVGDIQDTYPTRVYTIGYIPETLPVHVEPDKRYRQLRTTEGLHFDHSQSLQYWIDILSSGIPPSAVKVIGLGGNSLSSFEYLLATALGAKVAVIGGTEESLRVEENDLLWSPLRDIPVLPKDAYTLRAYIGIGYTGLPNPIRESIAVALNRTYRANYPARLPLSPEALGEWDGLPVEMKESNRQAVDHIVQKLNEIDCILDVVEEGKVPLYEFSRDEIGIMAEMEHARWVAERLMAGWKYGPIKDLANRISPMLIPWGELDQKSRDIDLKLVKDLPKFLAGFKLQIKKKK